MTGLRLEIDLEKIGHNAATLVERAGGSAGGRAWGRAARGGPAAGRAAAGARRVQEDGAHRGEFGIERVKLQEVRDLGSHDLARPGALGGALEGLEPGGVAVEGEDAAPFADES